MHDRIGHFHFPLRQHVVGFVDHEPVWPARARAQFGAARDELHALLREDAPDPDAVMSQAEKVGAAETALHKQRLRTLLEVRTLLTPEQRAKLSEIFAKKRQRMKMERHGGEAPAPE